MCNTELLEVSFIMTEEMKRRHVQLVIKQTNHYSNQQKQSMQNPSNNYERKPNRSFR